MERVVRLLSDYVNKCAKCFYYKVDECGYANKALEAPELSDKEFDALIPSEKTLHRTKEMHIPCAHQYAGFQLIEQIDALVGKASFAFSSKWLLSYFTKLNEIREKVLGERDTFQSSILPDLNKAIAHTLARIDLVFLKNGHDIGYFLGLVDMSSERISLLNSICPPKIVQHYLKQASPLEGYCEQKEQVVDKKPREKELCLKQFKDYLGVVEPRFPDRSASFELKEWMRDQRNLALIENILIQFGYSDIVGDDSAVQEYVNKGDEKAKDFEEWLYTDFGRWEELKQELFGVAERNRDNILVLQKTLGRQVEACSSLARYCFPSSDATLLEKEAAVLIKLLSNTCFPTVDDAIGIWNAAKQEASQLISQDTDEAGYLDMLYRLSLESAEELKCSSSPYVLVCSGRVRNYMKRLAVLVESALFRFCPSLHLSGIEKRYNISISDGVTQDDISHELGWHTSEEIQRIEQESGVSSGSLSQEPQQLIKQNPPGDLPLCGVDEVDNLGYYFFQAKEYAKQKAQEDRVSFRKLCYAKAEDKALTVEDKEIWILRVLQTIDTAYALALNGDENDRVLEGLARNLSVVLECTFMAVPNPICVKRIGMENDLSLIFRLTIDWDKKHPLDEIVNTTRFYDVQGEIGGNVALFERKMCNQCEIKQCPYRYIMSKSVEMVVPDDCPEEHIKDLTGYEMDEEESGEGGSTPVVTFAPLEVPLSRAESYLKALYPRFVNENYKWKKGLDGCTLYHAYWAAFIIKQTYEELTIESIGDLFDINSLRSYGTSAKRKKSYMVAIVDQFKKAKLSIPELPEFPES